jgi:hypothetical protein
MFEVSLSQGELILKLPHKKGLVEWFKITYLASMSP